MSFAVTIPVLSEKISAQPGQPATYRVRPLFLGFGVDGDDHWVAYNRREDRALANLAQDLRNSLIGAGRELRHDEIKRWSFCPSTTSRFLPLTISLRKQTLRGKFLFVSFEALGRRVVLWPGQMNLSFELRRGDDFEPRVLEVLTEHLRHLEREGEELPSEQDLDVEYARVTTLELMIRSRQKFRDPSNDQFAMLTGTQKMSGAAELERTGRCLNRQFPRDLHRAILRDQDVATVEKHFGERNTIPAPLALAGPSLVGKTAVIHEYLFRRLDGTGAKPEVWLLTPQRLIAGMSFVGQWEERVHAILKEASRRKLILYFDDLPGLFEAGRSRDSDLTVGHVLKSYLEEKSVRVLAEMTLGAWRKLREIDRGFADLFKVVRIRETTEEETMQVLTRAMQDLELERQCEFAVEVLPEVVNLQRRFARGRAFPGKAVEMMRQLARMSEAESGRRLEIADVQQFFHSKSGIANQFLTSDGILDPGALRGFFQSRIKGQDDAVQALVDVTVSCAKQINDPGRPLASLLFLGPTGVGKTESAKALASYFFGTSERLLRFDMNEFVAGDAVARLIGSQGRPHGVLTAAIRRQPYSVLLLDEIEKAHPAVFDLLLQLLGDGRLTDARGETADFTNCVVILTSNLGARAVRHQLGFGGSQQEEGTVYREAAESFFRPEFFNRLDRVVAFRELSREAIESLVLSLSQRALSRQGLRGRRLTLSIDPRVNAVLAERGFEPEYGARALRRAIEQHLVEPLALNLAALPEGEPATVRLELGAQDELNFRSTRFEAAQRSLSRLTPVSLNRVTDVLDACSTFVQRIEDELEENWFADDDGAFDPTDPLRVSYFGLREELDYLRRMRERLAIHLQSERKQPAGQRMKPSRTGKMQTHLEVPREEEDGLLRAFYDAADSGRYLTALADRSQPVDFTTHLVGELIFRANRISQLASPQFQHPDRTILRLWGSSPDFPEDHRKSKASWRLYQQSIMRYLSFAAAPPNREGLLLHRFGDGGAVKCYPPDHRLVENFDPAFRTACLYAEGPALQHWLSLDGGVQVFATNGGVIDFCSIELFPLEEEETPEQGFERVCAIEPVPLDNSVRVTRLHHENGYSCDLQSGRVTSGLSMSLWSTLLPLIEGAPEFAEFFEEI